MIVGLENYSLKKENRIAFFARLLSVIPVGNMMFHIKPFYYEDFTNHYNQKLIIYRDVFTVGPFERFAKFLTKKVQKSSKLTGGTSHSLQSANKNISQQLAIKDRFNMWENEV